MDTAAQPVSRAQHRQLQEQTIDPIWAKGKTIHKYGGPGVQVDLAGVFSAGGLYVVVEPEKRTSFTFRQGVDLLKIDWQGAILKRVKPRLYEMHYEAEDRIAVRHYHLSALPPTFKGGRKSKRGKIS